MTIHPIDTYRLKDAGKHPSKIQMIFFNMFSIFIRMPTSKRSNTFLFSLGRKKILMQNNMTAIHQSAAIFSCFFIYRITIHASLVGRHHVLNDFWIKYFECVFIVDEFRPNSSIPMWTFKLLIKFSSDTKELAKHTSLIGLSALAPRKMKKVKEIPFFIINAFFPSFRHSVKTFAGFLPSICISFSLFLCVYCVRQVLFGLVFDLNIPSFFCGIDLI